MSLLKRKVTNPLLQANRANSQKSTGPQTELGKRHSSQNAAKHLVYARVSPESMKALGEDPAEFEELRNFLTGALVPRDDFEQMLVDDMAELRWRRGRLLRAEAGIIASQKREFELDHERSVAIRGTGQWSFIEGHGDWAKEPGNLASIGLPDAVREAIQGIPNDYGGEIRKRILLALMAAGGFRLRGHGDWVAIEFTVDTASALLVRRDVVGQIAGAYTLLTWAPHLILLTPDYETYQGGTPHAGDWLHRPHFQGGEGLCRLRS
jgi:hypothetical protein